MNKLREILSATILPLLLASTLSAAPGLTINYDHFDFGLVPRNSTVMTGFWLHSTGEDTLKISEIKTGCSCVLAPLERKEIAPGDSLFLQLTWEMKNKVSKVGKYPYIYTNAQDDPFRVYMDGVVMRDPDSAPVAYSTPYVLELARVGEKLIDSLEFDLTNKFEHDLMAEVTSPQPLNCNLVLPEILPAFGSAKGYIKVKPGLTEEEFKTSFTLRFTDPESTTLTIPVRFRIIGGGN
ncbi:MAG: DUF1573 domain-containing protein [bacterium]|nr:DUF1573 domain-containing protein [bacterium]